jgi:hypothetical protein
MPRTEKETTFQGQLYMKKGRDGSREAVAGVDSGAEEIQVAADTDNGLAAGSLQAALESLAARIQALEDAP